jgi:phenylacetate-CoA oxygenase PaaI subunit
MNQPASKTDKPTLTSTSDPTDLPEKTQGVLLNLLLQLADNKYVLGRRYGEWTNSAPLLEAAVAAAAMTQDELGHARSLYPLLRTFPGAPPVLKKEEDRADLINVDFLDKPFQNWIEFVAANFLFDQAMSFIFEGARESIFEPLKQRAAKILQEEQFHAMYGATWLRSLSKPGTQAQVEMEATLQRIWPAVLCWLGRPGEPYQHYALEVGLLGDDVDTLRQKFLSRTGPLLRQLAYDLPVSYDSSSERWSLTGDLPWDRWDPVTRRLKNG